MAIPTKDSLLVPFSTNVNTRINASPGTWNLSAPEAAAYTAVHDPYVASYEALVDARAAGNRSESLTALKDAAKATLLSMARELYADVQASTTISNANKLLLGVRPRVSGNTPVPVPATSPKMTIVSVVGWTVRILLQDAAEEARRGRPPGTSGASVFSYVGAEAPTEISAWKFEGNTGKTKIDVVFPSTLAPGSKVFLSSFWFNGSKQSGTACAPISTNLQGGSVSLAA